MIQGLGILAFAIGIITYQFNKKKTILMLLIIFNLIYGVQYLLLGSPNSMFMCIFGAVRNAIFYFENKFSIRIRYYILSFFIVLSIAITTLNFNGILSILSCVGAILSTLAVWYTKEKSMRFWSFLSACVWLAHDIIIGSYAAILDTSIVTISILIGIYRFDIKGCKASLKNEEI